MVERALITLTGVLCAALSAPALAETPLSIPLADGAVTIEGDASPASAVAWTGDALWVAHAEGGLTRWDLKDGQASSRDTPPLVSLAAEPGGALAGAGPEGAWFQRRGGRTTDLTGHAEAITAAIWSPGGRWVATADGSGRVVAWDAGDGGPRWTAQLSGAVSELRWSADGRRVWANVDGAFTALDAASGTDTGSGDAADGEPPGPSSAPENTQRGRHWRAAEGDASASAWSPSGERLLTGAADGTARIVNAVGRRGDDVPLIGHPGAAVAAALSPDGALVATAGADGGVLVRRTSDLALVARLQTASTSALAFSADGALLATAGDFGAVWGWDLATGEEAWSLMADGEVLDLAFSPSGDQLAVGLNNGARTWDARTLAPLQTVTGVAEDVAWSPSGERLAALGGGQVQLLGIDGTVQSTLEAPSNPAALAWSGAGLAAAGDTALLWRDGSEASSLVTLVSVPGGAWAAFDAAGRFDDGGAEGAVRWSLQGEAVGLDQLRSYYYEPGLLTLHLAGGPLVAARPLAELALYPAIVIEAPAEGAWPLYTVTVRDRGGGIGAVEARLNGSDISGFLRMAWENASERVYRLDLSGTRFYDRTGENELKIWAFDGGGGLSSPRGGSVRSARPSENVAREPIAMWGLFVGVHDYRGEDLDLTFPSGDARAMYEATTLAATEDIYRRGVNMRLLTTDSEDPADRPTRANLEAAFAALSAAQPQDVVVLYMAGHGMTHAGEYYYPTSEFGDHETLDDPVARAQRALSDTEIQDWLLDTGASKRAIILDTCEAGGLSDDLGEGGPASRSADVTRAQALEDLYDRTGVFVLAGASEGKKSYEASRYGHGVLSYALLQGMRGPGLVDGDLVDVGQLFLHVQRQVPELARGIGGVQEPEVKLPKGGSVVIGRLPRDRVDQIVLHEALPVLLPSTFSRPQDDSDPLQLTEALNDRLEQLTYDQSAAAVYVSYAELPDAYRLQGRYAIDAEEVTAVARLLYRESALQDGASVAGFKLTVTSPADPKSMAAELDRAVQKWLRHGEGEGRTEDGVLLLSAEEAAKQYELLANPTPLGGRRPSGCEQEDTLTRSSDLSQALGWARLSFGQSPGAFAASMSRLDTSLRCLTDPVDDRSAWMLHRAHGLEAWDAEGLDPVPFLAASNPISSEFTTRGPGGERDEYGVLVENQVAIEFWEPGDALVLPPSARGRVRLDGEYIRTTPADEPYVFQRVSRSGRVLDTQYVRPDEPPPSYPRLRRRLAIAGATSTAAAAAMYASAYYTHCQIGWTDSGNGGLCADSWRLDHTALDQATVEGKLRTNQALIGGATGAATVALGAFVGLGISYAY